MMIRWRRCIDVISETAKDFYLVRWSGEEEEPDDDADAGSRMKGSCWKKSCESQWYLCGWQEMRKQYINGIDGIDRKECHWIEKDWAGEGEDDNVLSLGRSVCVSHNVMRQRVSHYPTGWRENQTHPFSSPLESAFSWRGRSGGKKNGMEEGEQPAPSLLFPLLSLLSGCIFSLWSRCDEQSRDVCVGR